MLAGTLQQQQPSLVYIVHYCVYILYILYILYYIVLYILYILYYITLHCIVIYCTISSNSQVIVKNHSIQFLIFLIIVVKVSSRPLRSSKLLTFNWFCKFWSAPKSKKDANCRNNEDHVDDDDHDHVHPMFLNIRFSLVPIFLQEIPSVLFPPSPHFRTSSLVVLLLNTGSSVLSFCDNHDYDDDEWE